MRIKYQDFPFDDCVRKAREIIQQGEFLVVQKFSCEHCGQRLGMPVPNTFFATGTCDQCGKETNIRKTGCNYTLMTDHPLMRAFLKKEAETS